MMGTSSRAKRARCTARSTPRSRPPGEQNAVDLSEPSKLLQEAIVATKSDDYRHALDLTTILQAKAERRLAELAARQISTLRTSLPHLGDDSGSLKALANPAYASVACQ